MGANASAKDPAMVSTEAMRLFRPEGSTTTSSPGFTTPDTICPPYPRYVWSGRITHCTGNRNVSRLITSAMGVVSRISRTLGPVYQPISSLPRATLSPLSADTGTERTCTNSRSWTNADSSAAMAS